MQQVSAMTDDTHTGDEEALPSDLMTVTEAATLLGISRGMVAMWAVRGHISKWRQGPRRILVSLAEVRELARIRKVE